MIDAVITTSVDIAACQKIRYEVFTLEQGVSVEDDIDGRDEEALHLLASAGGVAVGTARILFAADAGKIGRVAVLPSHRGTGLGKALILFALEEIAAKGCKSAKLGAQTHAIGFYEALGFEAVGPEFMDAGIPHREMVVQF